MAAVSDFLLLLCAVTSGAMTSSLRENRTSLAFTVPPQSRVIGLGTNISVPCEVSGFPPPILFWKRQSHNVGMVRRSSGPVYSRNSKRVYVDVNGTLHIDDVMPSDGGVYACVAMNQTEKRAGISKKVMLRAMDLRLPIAAPSGVGVTRVTGEYLFVYWTPPPKQNPTINITGYQIVAYYNSRYSRSYTLRYNVTGDFNVKYGVIPDIHRSQQCQVSVAAYNTKGMGPFSRMIKTETGLLRAESARQWEEMTPTVTLDSSAAKSITVAWPLITYFEGHEVKEFYVRITPYSWRESSRKTQFPSGIYSVNYPSSGQTTGTAMRTVERITMDNFIKYHYPYKLPPQGERVIDVIVMVKTVNDNVRSMWSKTAHVYRHMLNAS